MNQGRPRICSAQTGVKLPSQERLSYVKMAFLRHFLEYFVYFGAGQISQE